jgi:SpoVK/Ycf46/Vps4 family AAA+-type ATPase
MVVQRKHGLDLQEFDLEIPTLDITENYGGVWQEKHEKLLESLTTKKKKGIALLHGLPGTGKSMYIRHLISILCENRTVIYLPNQLIDSITDPGFIPLMAEYSGSILVIEDADDAIKSRKAGGRTVDKLLNLADGILSDFLGTQIICTFNSDITTIDEALLRKGRLILKHKFGKLPREQAQRLSDNLGFKTIIDSDMTLAEIYNQEDVFGGQTDSSAKIGF